MFLQLAPIHLLPDWDEIFRFAKAKWDEARSQSVCSINFPKISKVRKVCREVAYSGILIHKLLVHLPSQAAALNPEGQMVSSRNWILYALRLAFPFYLWKKPAPWLGDASDRNTHEHGCDEDFLMCRADWLSGVWSVVVWVQSRWILITIILTDQKSIEHVMG